MSPNAAVASKADNDRKARIISHMNRGHARELSHYLRHFAGASSSAASSPTLQDATLESLTISSRGKDYVVPLSPPLKSWDEARERLVAMDTEARGALGISDVVVDEYVPPTGFAAVVFGSVLFYFVCAAGLPWVVPGSGVWDLLEAIFPGGPEFFRWLVRAIFWPVVLIHVVELTMFEKTKLRKYSVQPWSRAWWLWVLTVSIQGYPTFDMIEEVANKKRAEKESKSH